MVGIGKEYPFVFSPTLGMAKETYPFALGPHGKESWQILRKLLVGPMYIW